MLEGKFLVDVHNGNLFFELFESFISLGNLYLTQFKRMFHLRFDKNALHHFTEVTVVLRKQFYENHCTDTTGCCSGSFDNIENPISPIRTMTAEISCASERPKAILGLRRMNSIK